MIATILFYIFLVSLGIQLFYYLFVFSRLSFYKKPKSKNLNLSTPPVTVIVCARNEYENLQKLLPALEAQDYPDFELIVVNDRSSDQSEELLREVKARFPKLRTIHIEETPAHANPKKYALTLAIKSASHEWLILTDADCVPASKEWIKEMSKHFKPKTSIVLGYSPYQKTKGFLNYFIRFETLYTAIQYFSLCLAAKPYMGVGRNLAYRKSLFMKNKGFIKHLKLTGGDDDLFVNAHATAKNTEIAVGQEKSVISVPKAKFKPYIRQKRRHLSVGKYYKFSDKLILGLLSFTHIVFWASLIALAGLGKEPYWLAGGFLCRVVVQFVIFATAAKKLGEKINLWALPFLDVIFAVYYLLTGLSVIFSKQLRWK